MPLEHSEQQSTQASGYPTPRLSPLLSRADSVLPASVASAKPANAHATNSQVFSSYHSQPWDSHSDRSPSPSPVLNPRSCPCLQLAARSATAPRDAAQGLRLAQQGAVPAGDSRRLCASSTRTVFAGLPHVETGMHFLDNFSLYLPSPPTHTRGLSAPQSPTTSTSAGPGSVL